MIENNITAITIVLGAVTAICLSLVVFLFWRLRRLEGDYEFLSRGSEGRNFVEIVNENIAQTGVLLDEVDKLSDNYAFVLRRMAGMVQHVGVVRYDAFRDLGGLLSFSIALLDDRGNGLVISSIYGRSESRTYAKPIVERGSSYELSPEEKEAIRLAMQSRELGSLPVEARDLEHEERMANLKLFHDKDYLEQSRATGEGRPSRRAGQAGGRGAEPYERRVEAGPRSAYDEEADRLRPRPTGAGERARRRAPGEEEAPAAGPTGRPAEGSRARGAGRGRGRVAREEPTAEKRAERTAAGRAPRDEAGADSASGEDFAEIISKSTKWRQEIDEVKPPGRGATGRPRSLNTPVERLRDREKR